MLHETLDVALRVGAIFDDLGIDWLVGGSVASSLHGIPRATQDVDLVAALRRAHTESFVEAAQNIGYVDMHSVRQAVASGRSFNIIDDETVTKIDVFIARSSARLAQLERRRYLTIGETRLPVATAEDIIVEKLAWYRAGGESSERQWRDVLGVLKVSAEVLDTDLLQELAQRRSVIDLLDKALADG